MPASQILYMPVSGKDLSIALWELQFFSICLAKVTAFEKTTRLPQSHGNGAFLDPDAQRGFEDGMAFATSTLLPA